MNIGYFRVSKENETLQDLEQHIKVTLDHFNLKKQDIEIYKERGSAYDLNKFYKRLEFRKLLNKLFNAENITVMDLFDQKVKKQDIKLYIYDFSRIMRNLEFNLFFNILCCFCNVEVYSYKEGKMEINENDSPSKKFTRYILLMSYAYSAEDYSYNTSQNIKKAVENDRGITISAEGKKWGRQIMDVYGNPIDIDNTIKIYKKIERLIKKYELEGRTRYYPLIQKIIEADGVKISKNYIKEIKLKISF